MYDTQHIHVYIHGAVLRYRLHSVKPWPHSQFNPTGSISPKSSGMFGGGVPGLPALRHRRHAWPWGTLPGGDPRPAGHGAGRALQRGRAPRHHGAHELPRGRLYLRPRGRRVAFRGRELARL